uniref:Uncharacterized protein n=1 Tax=Lactuca sativa TaxID=4236 RepID=A0A9R1XJ57_LACSA|nr:hypothetical protein LSAT_V11C400161140 [Lactuca sativa]
MLRALPPPPIVGLDRFRSTIHQSTSPILSGVPPGERMTAAFLLWPRKFTRVIRPGEPRTHDHVTSVALAYCCTLKGASGLGHKSFAIETESPYETRASEPKGSDALIGTFPPIRYGSVCKNSNAETIYLIVPQLLDSTTILYFCFPYLCPPFQFGHGNHFFHRYRSPVLEIAAEVAPARPTETLRLANGWESFSNGAVESDTVQLSLLILKSPALVGSAQLTTSLLPIRCSSAAHSLLFCFTNHQFHMVQSTTIALLDIWNKDRFVWRCEDILFLDLSLDPGLFEGPKGVEQVDPGLFEGPKGVEQDSVEERTNTKIK